MRASSVSEMQIRTGPARSPFHMPDFISFSSTWFKFLFKPLGHAYAALHDSVRNGPRKIAWVARDHFLFFVLAVVGAIFLAPKYLLMGEFVVKRFVLNRQVALPDDSFLPYVPNLLVPLFVLFFVTYFLNQKVRLGIVLASALPLTILADAHFDLPSVAVYLFFLSLVFLVTKCPIRKVLKFFSKE